MSEKISAEKFSGDPEKRKFKDLELKLHELVEAEAALVKEKKHITEKLEILKTEANRIAEDINLTDGDKAYAIRLIHNTMVSLKEMRDIDLKRQANIYHQSIIEALRDLSEKMSEQDPGMN